MTVKKTGGGAYDPSSRQLYFAAGTAWTPGSPVNWPPNILVAVNDLSSETAERVRLRSHLDRGRRVLLDSGIFWLAQQHRRTRNCSLAESLTLAPEDMDGFAELYDRYVKLVHRYGDRLWGFVELDQGGAVNKRRTRARLEADGITPMPVYHPINDGWDYFDELASGYDRIAMGNVVHAKRGARLRLMHTLWERHRAYPDLWVHVLGITANEWCLAAPPDSCDSSAWLAAVRFPRVITETVQMRPARALGPGFAYDVDDPEAPGRDRTAAYSMCADGVRALNLVWQHATAQTDALLQQPGHPAYLPGEQPLTPQDPEEPPAP